MMDNPGKLLRNQGIHGPLSQSFPLSAIVPGRFAMDQHHRCAAQRLRRHSGLSVATPTAGKQQLRGPLGDRVAGRALI